MLLLSCSSVSKNDDGTVTTTYGFNLVDVQSEFGQPDSMRVVVLNGVDTLSSTHYTVADLDGTKLFFDITVAENAQVKVAYQVFAGGTAVAAGEQIYVSGDNLSVPRPMMKPVANAGPDTTLIRGTENRFVGSVDKRAELATGYAWDYEGDGRFDDEFEANKGFVKMYNDTGSFVAIFRVTGKYGLNDIDTVKVRVQNPLPEIESFAAPSRVTAGNEAELEVKASSAFTKIVNYEWDLGADGSWDSTGKSMDALTVEMGNVGDWKVKVRVTDDEGRQVEAEETIEVVAAAGNLPPEIDLLFQTDSVVSIHDAVGWRVDFSDGNTRADVVKYEWDLDGDGNYETVKTTPDSLAQAYNTPGNYTIRVRITDDGGESATASKTLRVVLGVPTASLGVDRASVGIGETVTFTASASDPNDLGQDGSILQYEWDFGSDGVFDRTTTSPAATFAYPDADANHVYTALVRVTDDDGNTAVASQTVTVVNRAPVLNAIAVSASPVSIKKPSVLQVDLADFTDPDGNEIASITWSFSDGVADRTLGRNDTLWLVRATPGTVTVTATVRDKYGLSASQTARVDVSAGTAQVTGAGNVFATAGADVALNPTVTFSLGQALASCRWKINGGAFGGSSATCATTLTMPAMSHSDYQATFEATSDVGTTSTQTVHIRVREALVDSRDSKRYAVETYNYGGADHVWMVENLNYSNQNTVGWCYEGLSANCENGYGRLYDWNAATSPDICPSGWHVPSDAEWSALLAYVEDQDAVSNNAGAWLQSDAGSGLVLGFVALPAGYRDNIGGWDGRTNSAFFWSSSSYSNDATQAWSRYLDYGTGVVYSNNAYKNYAYSLRCVQN